MKTAPLILFVYNRPDHTKRTIDALMMNEYWNETDVYVFCDGPRIAGDMDEKILRTRRLADEIKGSRSLHVSKSDSNLGLYNSILNGVSAVIEKHGSAIVVEDDIVALQGFLKYMNEALNKYEDEKQVACISGYVYPLKEKFDKAFFVRGADCWGWATWSDRWKKLNNDAGSLMKQIRDNNLEKDFTFNNSYAYWQMLSDRNEKKNQSWAILWYASAFVHNQLCLYPPVSLVNNIGNDGSGTHTFIPTEKFGRVDYSEPVILPDAIEESRKGREGFERFFHSLKKPDYIGKIKSVIPDSIKRSAKNIFFGKQKFPWSGNYSSWQEARDHSTGYNAQLILNRVKESVLKVKNGEAVYERDSVLFDELHYSENILKTFNEVAENNAGNLHVTDFGGSLGSSYFQYRKIISDCKIRWNVIEQPHFVKCGKEFIQDDHLRFFLTVDQALADSEKHVLLLASVLPYVENAYALIEELTAYDFQYIIVDRTGFISGQKERLTVQTVPEEIYKASYPAWFFNEDKFVKAFSRKYSKADEFMSDVALPGKLGNEDVYWKGFIFKRKDG